jgi:tetratricopeptide (TPR) repeat protein
MRANNSQNHVEARRLNAEYQAAVRTYEAAARAFQQQNYAKAKELFEKLVSNPVLDVAERSRVHLRICEQRLNPAVPAPKGAAEHYDLGVAELNARRLDDAIEHLSKALKSAPERDEIHYALAAAYALRGDADAALDRLKAAVTLRAQNRYLARGDKDFEALRADARFQALVYS